MLFPLSALSILTSVILILLCCFILARYRQLFDRLKFPLAVLTVIGGLILYTIGYMPVDGIVQWGSQGNGNTGADGLLISTVALRAIYSTCRIFIMESDFGDINEALKSNGFYLMAITMVHTLGVMLTVMTVLSFIGMKFLSRMKLFFASAKQVYIFLGLNEATENLIKCLKKNGKSRCFIVIENLKDREEDGDLIQKLREDRLIILDHSWETITSLKKLQIPGRLLNNEVHLFALSDDENKNARAALTLLKEAQKANMSDDRLHFYINTADEGVEKTFDAFNQEHDTHYDLKVFNLPDLTARQLFEAYPIHDFVPLDTSLAKACSGFTLFLAGLGPTGIEILRKSLYLGQFMGGDYRAILIDSKMAQKRGLLFNKYPGLKGNYQIETFEAEPGCEAFYEVLEKNIQTINYIAVALGDDAKNMETAIEIQRLIKRSQCFKQPIIAVHIRQQEEFEHLEKSELLPNIRFFGRSSDIFTESIIINESMDRMARKMNALFNSIYHMEPADNWGSLDAFTKESNRSASSNIATKLRLLGLKMVEKGIDRASEGENGTEEDIKLENIKEMREAEFEASTRDAASAVKRVNLADYLVGERLDNLARQEHLRWNAFHYASGWTTWPLSQTGESKKAKDLKNKRHACLVSWDELVPVTEHFNQNPTYQDLDYEQVKNITMILEHVGYEVYERVGPTST